MGKKESGIKIIITGDKTKVNSMMVRRLQEAANIMVRKNAERGDCWQATCMMGAFVELHTCYNRLREMLWVRHSSIKLTKEFSEELLNVTQDMRNFTILLEMALDARLVWGNDQEKVLPYLKKPIPFELSI